MDACEFEISSILLAAATAMKISAREVFLKDVLTRMRYCDSQCVWHTGERGLFYQVCYRATIEPQGDRIIDWIASTLEPPEL